MDTFITVATFQYPHEAHVLQSTLEAEGIKVFLKDEFTVQVDPFLSNAVGGVKLQVHKADAERAIELLKDIKVTENNSFENDEADSPSILPEKFQKDEPTSKIKPSTIVLLVAIVIILFYYFLY